MTEPVGSAGHDRVRALEAEILAMRQQIEQRDELLRVLNRRLLQLERGEPDRDWARRSDAQRVQSQNGATRNAVRSLLDSELFRWTLPVRRLRAKVYARRRGLT